MHAFKIRFLHLAVVLLNQPFLFFHPFPILFIPGDVWVIIKNRYLEVFPQIFQHIAAAWRTAAVEQQLSARRFPGFPIPILLRFPRLVHFLPPGNYFIQFLGIIPISIHSLSPFRRQLRTYSHPYGVLLQSAFTANTLWPTGK